jgi:hypothetical protein
VTLPRFPSNEQKSFVYEIEILHIDVVITGDNRKKECPEPIKPLKTTHQYCDMKTKSHHPPHITDTHATQERQCLKRFFWNTATRTWITTKHMVDYNTIQKFLTKKNLHFIFYTKAVKPVMSLSSICLALFLQRISLWPSRR